MHKIVFIVPYFGRFNNYFSLWLLTCKNNPTVDWLIFTDDKRSFDYPSNVKVIYCEFDFIRNLVQSKYDFSINLENPYKLCDYRVAYGDIFQEYISDYDFWGYCDQDVLWGDFRRFLTDEVLRKYNKISWRGHMTLFRNTDFYNELYKKESHLKNYKFIFQSSENEFFDEVVINDMFDIFQIPYLKFNHFADLKIRSFNFILLHQPEEEEYKNTNQLFLWDNGKLFRKYIFEDKVYSEELLYVHFLKRPMKNLISDTSKVTKISIIPNVLDQLNHNIDVDYILKSTKKRFYYEYWLPRLKPTFICKKIKQKITGRYA